MQFQRSLLVFPVLVLLVTAARIHAGPLNPPVGPITSTSKPIAEVEPRIAINATNTPGNTDNMFIISQPGSYYLTGNITGVAGKRGIAITASGVTVDLNGFDLVGVPGSVDGVAVTVFPTTNVTVLNGSVRDWGGNGVSCANALNGRIQGVLASGNFLAGIRGGNKFVISQCVSFDNISGGILSNSGSSVEGCTAHSNSGSGFTLGIGSTIVHCSAASNTGDGFTLNSSSNVTNSTSTLNGARGFSLGNGGMISHCVANSNTGDGISVSSLCMVLQNTCNANGQGAAVGAGVHAVSSENRIEGNSCTAADVGVDADAGANLVFRNSCAGNTTNFSLAAGNVYGNIVDRTAPGSPAVSGNSASSTSATTDPNANFSY